MSFNANGIRAAVRKGFFDWFLQQSVDVLCVQELKAKADQLTDAVFHCKGYHRFLFPAERPGYSGVAIYSRQQPDHIHSGLGWPCADQEGRYLEATFGDLCIASLYLPSGSSGDHRQSEKFDFMARYAPILEAQRQSGKSFIICGDWNIVHREIDIKNFKSNQKSSGCLPEERAWLDHQLTQMGWVDAFRVLNQSPGQYTWWSQRGKARENNVGWRIDYQLVTPHLKPRILDVQIHRTPYFSDHAPLTVDYQL